MIIKKFNENFLNFKPISEKIDNDFLLEITKTDKSYKISVKDLISNKVVGRLYLMYLKKKDDGYWAEARRFYINDGYRNKNIDKIIVNAIKKYFKKLNIYAYPSPNRFKDLTDDNKEEYRKKLSRLYSMYGMKKVGNKSRMEIKRFNESFHENRVSIDKFMEIKNLYKLIDFTDKEWKKITDILKEKKLYRDFFYSFGNYFIEIFTTMSNTEICKYDDHWFSIIRTDKHMTSDLFLLEDINDVYSFLLTEWY